MKKFIFGLIAILAISFASAQSTATTTPRFSTESRGDNTGRVLTYAVISTTDLAQATLDTITIQPSAFQTIVCMKVGTAMQNLSDSVCYKFSSRNTVYRLGDECVFMVSKGTGAGKIKFGGSQYILSTASAAVAVAANKTLIMRFVWNGSKWVEVDRMIQP